MGKRTEYHRAYRAAHPEEVRAWRAATNVERKRATNKAWRDRNRERIARVNRAWRERNPERMKALVKEWNRAHADRKNAADARWRARNPEAIVTFAQRRRALVRSVEGAHTTAEWRALVQDHRGCCYYCGQERPLTRDHKLPLSRGGSNAIGNIVPACGPCNFRKATRTAEEFLEAPRAA